MIKIIYWYITVAVGRWLNFYLPVYSYVLAN